MKVIDFTDLNNLGKVIEMSLPTDNPSHTHKDIAPVYTPKVDCVTCVDCAGVGSLTGFIANTFGIFLSSHSYTVKCKQCDGCGTIEIRRKVKQ